VFGDKERIVATTMLTGAATRRERGRQEMREAILAAARRLVTEEGIGALNMRAVAREIGYSVAALYEYFPAKEDILACLYFEGAEGLAGRMRSALDALAPEATAAERLRALGTAYRAFAHEQTELFRICFGRPAPHAKPGGGPEGPDSAFDVLIGVAQEGIERGEFVPIPPLVLAVTAWTAVHGFVMLELDGHFKLGPAACGLPEDVPLMNAPSIDALFGTVMQLLMTGVRHSSGDGPRTDLPQVVAAP
jgi:AcrR family transcriptional regulator